MLILLTIDVRRSRAKKVAYGGGRIDKKSIALEVGRSC